MYDFIPDFISEHEAISENELCDYLKLKADGSYFTAYCQYTTGIICEPFDGTISDTAHLLEIRLFNQTKEIRAVRTGIGKDFISRIIDDEIFKAASGDEFEERTLTELQFLDVDPTKTDGRNYHFIGGGSYTLPIENAEKIEIRNYGVYDENGIFGLVDFRIVRILAKGES